MAVSANKLELLQIADAVAREKSIDRGIVISAMEDAIALKECFDETDDPLRALPRFQEIRKPVIEDYQAAAYESMEWFEHARDYIHLSPIELAYSLMTRSGRVDDQELARRDPEEQALVQRPGPVGQPVKRSTNRGQPEDQRGSAAAAHTRTVARAERRHMVWLWRIKGDACLEMQAGRRKPTQAKPGYIQLNS